MDYYELAENFMETMRRSHRGVNGRNIEDSMRGEFMILRYIVDRKGNVAPSEIAKAVGLTTARVASALNGLEKKGMVVRSIDPDDRRKIIVNLTEEGNRQSEVQSQQRLEFTAQMMEYLGKEDAQNYVRILKKLENWKPVHKTAADAHDIRTR